MSVKLFVARHDLTKTWVWEPAFDFYHDGLRHLGGNDLTGSLLDVLTDCLLVGHVFKRVT